MKISVIIPVYNTSIWLEKLWKSLKEQTIFNQLEIIFINDGSTDNSLEILKNLTKNEKNVVIISEKNSGVSSARNIGIDNAKCKYITFVDSDDYLDNDYFEMLLVNANRSKGDIVISGFINNYKNTCVVKKPSKNETVEGNVNIIKDFLIGKIEPNSTNKLFNRNIIGDLRFDKSYIVAEDKIFVYNYLKKISKASYISDAKYHYNHTNELAVTKTQFNAKKMSSIDVSKKICEDVENNYKELLNYALSADIDVKCRVYCDMYKNRVMNDYHQQYKTLKKEIKKFSLLKKIKFSNKKHFFTLLFAKIHPSLYIFIKEKMKLQYK